MGVLNKLKKVFKGKNLPDTSKKALASKQRKKPSAPKDEQSFRRKLIEEKKKQNKKVKQVRRQFENAKPSSGGSATGVKRTDKPKAKVAVAKTATDSYLKKVPEARNSKIDFTKDLVESRARQRERLMNEYHKRTNDRYNVEKNGNKARQAIKSGEYMSDPEVAKFEVDKHPIASSAARGALNGVTFGLSDLAINKLPMNPANREAEEYYQAHKNKGAEIAGEIAGSLASFGLTGGASKAVVGKGATKLLGKEAVEKATTSVVDRVAGNALIRRAAMREALKKVGTTATEKEIAQFARNRAIKLVDAIGEDMAINLTTGAVSDISHAILDSDDPKSFMQNMAASAGMNLALGGATTLLPTAISSALPTGRIAQTAENAAESLARNADEAVRPTTVEEAVRTSENGLPPVEEVERMADELEARNAKTEAEINARQTAETPKTTETPKAEPADKAVKPSMKMRKDELKALAESRKIEVPEKATKKDILGLLNGNDAEPAVKAETVKTEVPKAETPKAEPKPKATENNPDNFASIDDGIEGINESAEASASLEARAKEIAETSKPAEAGAEPTKINGSAPLSNETPKGVRQAREIHAYETGEEVGGSVKTTWDEAWSATKEYHESGATGAKNRRSKVSVSQLNAMDSDAERELRQKLADAGELNYDVVHTEEMYDKVAKQMRDEPDHWVKAMIDVNEGEALDFRATPEWQARVQYIMATVDPSADPASEIAYTEAFKLAKELSSKGGQVLNLRRNFVHLTEAGKRDATLDTLARILYKSKGFSKNHAKELKGLGYHDKMHYIKKVLMDDSEIADSIKNLTKAKKPDAVTEAFEKLMVTVNKQNPKSGFDVVQEIRYLNMLGNPKTHIRNVFGSGFFAPIRQTSNMIRSGLEKAVTKATGVETAKHGGWSWTAIKEAHTNNPTTTAGKKAAEAFENLKNDILGSTKYEQVKYKGRGKTAVGKALDKVSDFNAALLTKEDDYFRKRAFKENYIKGYMAYEKAGVPITPKIERKIEAEAIKEAQIATFNEYNEVANFLAKITRNASDPNASTGARVGGTLVNAVMPFTKVPANIMKQSVNYSPVGIARGFANIRTAAQRGDSELMNAAVDQLASGLTGTGIFALGMLMGKTTDWFTTNAGKDDYAAKFKKGQGVQNYSVTFTNPADGKKYSATLDWLVPTSATFFSGVEFANQLKEGDFNVLDFGGDWAQITSRLIEPVMETSMLSGLYSMLESTRNGYGNDDKMSAASVMLRETAQSYINSLVPTVIGQASRTAYKTDKAVTGETDWEYFKNSMKSKTGLAGENAVTKKFGIEPLGADTTLYGDVKGEKKNPEDYAKSVLKNFLSPANIQKVDLNQLDQEKIEMYEEAVKNGAKPKDMAYLFPKKQYDKNFSYGKTGTDKKKGNRTDVKMTEKELSLYNQAKTKGGEEAMRAALETVIFNRWKKDANGKSVPIKNQCYSKEEKQKLINQFKGKSIRDVEKYLYKDPLFKKASPAEQKQLINYLWSYDDKDRTVGAKREGERAVVKSRGGNLVDYDYKNEVFKRVQKNLAEPLSKGIVTKEQALDFARNAVKWYYKTDWEERGAGVVTPRFNKKEMMAYLEKKGYSEEVAAALYNAFKASNLKEYGASSGYHRRGWRRWHRWGGGWGSYQKTGGNGAKVSKTKVAVAKSKTYQARKAKKASLPSVKSSTVKANTEDLLSAALRDIQRTEAKVSPPKPKGGKK